MKKTSIAISIIVALLLSSSAQAEMITVGGDQTALTINQDITFTITTDYSGHTYFMFDEIVTSDGSRAFPKVDPNKRSLFVAAIHDRGAARTLMPRDLGSRLQKPKKISLFCILFACFDDQTLRSLY